ncbi:MAG: DNA polymerase III subunit alpha [Betaproteobacteria bacterium RIFCSPLOWO2_12_FULL_62_13]|nr:MAG: DNA polymerase III subunit alpha [Betaproteobacteria bacterium RIFCSPLOWO2_12_FULL_62_13]
MPDPSFVHLRLHSEYSIVDGIVRLDAAVAAAAADGMPALALTDLVNVFGLVKFYREARARGVKPIVGCDLWITNESDRDKPFRLLLLCQSRAGYLRLCELLTRAYRTNQHRGRAEIGKAWFAETGTDGLIALSGAHHGDVGQALAVGSQPQARKLVGIWQKLFPQRFYVELQRPGSGAMTTGAASVPIETYVQRAAQLAGELKLPVVATHPVQFLKPDDFRAHEARVCISEGYILSDQRRPRHFSPDQYFKSQAEMAVLFRDIPAALANSVEIAKRCNLTLELGKSQLPKFPTPKRESLEGYLNRRAAEGLDLRMRQLYPDEAARAARFPRYRERLEFELNTIVQMGFPGYFLIVADFINWAKTNGVPVGPGRGSGAGSLVAYSLGITDLDPLRHDLLFERFLNPERVSMPDFDIDFCQDGRDRVIDYVKSKYGADSVSQIATFGTMAAKAVVRDVGRVLDLPYNFCDQLAKLIPFQPGRHITLAEAREMEPQLKEREEKEEEVRELLALAGKLEGLTRNVGMHAGGVLIAPGKLTDFCPLYAADASGAAVSQFDKDDVESIGLVKFDFLGLTTLTILDWAVKYIRNAEYGMMNAERNSSAASSRSSFIIHHSSFDLDSIPYDDPATYALFASGNTTAIFQCESRGMRELMKQARPDCFEDIVALVALYRPGPMELIPEFIRRKHGGRVDYPDPRVEPILKPTYGIMVYQEQVMQIAQVIGGYSLGAADLLRRAMGKKLPEEMAQHRSSFVAGAAKNGVSERKSNELFDLMEKFAGYGFNRSHAAAYAVLAYQTAYLKAHYPAEFMAATLSADMDNTDKVQFLVDDARANDLEVLPPDIHLSAYRFVPVPPSSVSSLPGRDTPCISPPLGREEINKGVIRYGLGAIKGTGEAAIGHIVEARKTGGPFKDLFDFCHRVDKRIVNRRVVESLIRAGAFDSLDDHRGRLLASVGAALDSAEQASRSAHQVSLFEDLPDAGTRVALADVPRWSDRERLQNEKLALGFYLSGHPFKSYEQELRGFITTRLDQLTPQPGLVLLGGVVHSLRTQMTRRGRMAVILLDDGNARVEVSVFNELFEQHRRWLKEDELLIIEGKVSHDDFSGSLRISAEKLHDLQTARNLFARAIRLNCNGEASGRRLRELLEPYRRGTCPVSIVYSNRGATCEIDLGEAWRVNLHDDLVQALADWLKPENVEIVYYAPRAGQ